MKARWLIATEGVHFGTTGVRVHKSAGRKVGSLPNSSARSSGLFPNSASSLGPVESGEIRPDLERFEACAAERFHISGRKPLETTGHTSLIRTYLLLPRAAATSNRLTIRASRVIGVTKRIL